MSTADVSVAQAPPQVEPERRRVKIASIEFWRFLFTAIVCVYHLEIYFTQRQLLLSGSSAVEFFFILAGFTMAMSASRAFSARLAPFTVREAHTKALSYVVKKLKGIWPVLLVIMLFWAIGVMRGPAPQQGGFWGGFGGNTGGGAAAWPWGGWGTDTGAGTGGTATWPWGGGFGDTTNAWGGGFGAWGAPAVQLSPLMAKLTKLMNSEWEFLLLVGTPFGFNNGMSPNVPMWFLTALIVVGYVYTYAMYRHYDFLRFAAPVLGLLLYIFFALSGSSTLEHSIKMGFLNAGMVKAAAEMSLGICVYMIYEKLSARKLGAVWKVLLSLLEIYAVYRFFVLTVKAPVGMDNYRRIIYIMLIVLLSFLNITALSRILNKKVWKWLGSISLAMYLSHYMLINVYFDLLGKWKTYLSSKGPFDASAVNMLRFLRETGGFNERFTAIPMSAKDIILFLLLVMAASAGIMLLLAIVRKFIISPIKRAIARRAAEAAAEEGAV